MTKPLYFYNGSTFELVGPTTPQSPIAYQTSAPTGPATGDLWIDSDGDVDTYNRQLTRYYFVATAGQTTISGVDANSLTLAYVAGSEAVYVNGALQVRGQDYTATDGTSVVMSSALAVNDVVEIFAYTAFTVANAYTKAESDSLVGAAPGLKLLVPTSVTVGSGTASIGTAGQVTFTGASSVSLNGVFSSTYDNYRLLMSISSSSTNLSVNLRFRVGGTSASGSNYSSNGSNSASTTLSNVNLNATSLFLFDVYSTIAQFSETSCDILVPALTQYTRFNFQSYGENSSGQNVARSISGVHDVATAYDGIEIFTSTGNITGTVSVYGYKD
jgi:hypothetical protein